MRLLLLWLAGMGVLGVNAGGRRRGSYYAAGSTGGPGRTVIFTPENAHIHTRVIVRTDFYTGGIPQSVHPGEKTRPRWRQ